MTMDLFAGIPVRDYNAAVAWYERLLGAAPSFLPDDTEAVWELADHRYVYIDVRPEHAGHAMHTLFVGDFDARISQIAERGLEPAERGLDAELAARLVGGAGVVGEVEGDPARSLRPEPEGILRIWPASRRVKLAENNGRNCWCRSPRCS